MVGDNPDQVLTVSNLNGVPAGIASLTLTGSTVFSYTTTCGSTLAAGAACTVDVTFTPTAVTSYGGTLYIKESAGTIHNIALSGTAMTGD